MVIDERIFTVNKHEYEIRAEEINRRLDEGDFVGASEIADTIDWSRVKKSGKLCVIADIYRKVHRYEDAIDILQLAQERNPEGKDIIFSLCELYIKIDDVSAAVDTYQEFCKIASRDPRRYILQYKLYESQGVSLEERIAVLEEYKNRDYKEKWAYTLAHCLHRAGYATRCVEECDELITFFGEGKYVIKAMELKMLHEPLTPQQQEIYDNRFKKREETYYDASCDPRDVLPEVTADDERRALALGHTQVFAGVKDDDLGIQVRTMDVSEYGTVNLQQAIAEGVQEVLTNGSEEEKEAVTRTILAPMYESDTGELESAELEEISGDDIETGEIPDTAEDAVEDLPEEILAAAAQQKEEEGVLTHTEVFFGETGEIKDIEGALKEALRDESDHEKEISRQMLYEVASEQMDGTTGRVVEEGENGRRVYHPVAESAAEKEARTAEPPEEIAGSLTQEADGQIGLAMPEKAEPARQITGQLNISDVMIEWEKLKQETEERHKEEFHKRVKRETGELFDEFEKQVLDSKLAQLEREAEAEAREKRDREEAEAQRLANGEDILTQLADNDMDDEPEDVVSDEATEETERFCESEEEVAEAEQTEEAQTEEIPTEEIQAEEAAAEDGTQVEETAENDAEIEAAAADTEAETATDNAEEIANETEERSAQDSSRSLSKEQKELFATYIQSKEAKNDLAEMLDNISMASYTGNIRLTGDDGIDLGSFAVKILKYVRSSDGNFTGQVGKITGDDLNKKDVVKMVEQFSGGGLIIEGASAMNDETKDMLRGSLEKENLGIVVILTDKRKNMEKLLKNDERLMKMFNASMDVKALSEKKLVAFAEKYAFNKDYKIDQMGMLELHHRIEIRQTNNHAVNVVEVMQMVDEAIQNVNRKTPTHFFDILLGRRYDEEDRVILGEKDFRTA